MPFWSIPQCIIIHIMGIVLPMTCFYGIIPKIVRNVWWITSLASIGLSSWSVPRLAAVLWSIELLELVVLRFFSSVVELLFLMFFFSLFLSRYSSALTTYWKDQNNQIKCAHICTLFAPKKCYLGIKFFFYSGTDVAF